MEDLSILISTIKKYWEKELSDPKSLFYWESKIEDTIKRRFPRTGKREIAVLKSIKFSAFETGLPYFSEMEMAIHFGIPRANIARIRKTICDKTGMVFMRLPMKVINPSYSKHSPGRWIPIPPSLKVYIESLSTVCTISTTTPPTVCTISTTVCTVSKSRVDSFPTKIKYLQGEQEPPYVLPISYNIKTLCSSYKKVNFLIRTATSLQPVRATPFSPRLLGGKTIKDLEQKETLVELKLTSQKKDPLEFVSPNQDPLNIFKGSLVYKQNESNENGGGITLMDKKTKDSLETTTLDSRPERVLLKKKPRPRKVRYKDFGLYPKQSLKHIEEYRVLYGYMDELVLLNIRPKIEETKQIIQYWNSIDNLRFASHNVKSTGSETFKKICIAVSYHLECTKGMSMETLFSCIENFHHISKYNVKLKYIKSLKLINFLCCGDWLSMCTGAPDEVWMKSSGLKIEYETTLKERVFKKFVKYFYDGNMEMAKHEIQQNFGLFVKFTNQMVFDHKNREMYGLSISQYIGEYFSLAKRNTESWMDGEKGVNVKYILGGSMRGIFFRYMRSDPSFCTFGDLIHKEEENT